MSLNFMERYRLERVDFSRLSEFSDWRTQCVPVGQNHTSLDEILQLPDVSRPGMVNECLHHFARYPFDLLVQTLRVNPHKMHHEQRNVSAPIAQRRERYGKNVQPVVQIATELILGN